MRKKQKLAPREVLKVLSLAVGIINVVLAINNATSGGTFSSKHELINNTTTNLIVALVAMIIYLLASYKPPTRNSDRSTFKNAIQVEKTILIIFLVLFAISFGSIAAVLSFFVLYALVPLILIVVLTSVFNYKKLAASKYTVEENSWIVVNWIALIFLVINILN